MDLVARRVHEAVNLAASPIAVVVLLRGQKVQHLVGRQAVVGVTVSNRRGRSQASVINPWVIPTGLASISNSLTARPFSVVRTVGPTGS